MATTWHLTAARHDVPAKSHVLPELKEQSGWLGPGCVRACSVATLSARGLQNLQVCCRSVCRQVVAVLHGCPRCRT